MDLRRIIREEIEDDDLDWIRSIPAGLLLEPSTTYIIDCCENGYSEEQFRSKLIELFGDRWLGNHHKCNWFDNTYIQDKNNKCQLIIRINQDMSFNGGWNPCGSTIGRKSVTLTPNEFLRSVIRL